MLQGAATNAWWDGPYFHPRTWEANEVSMELISKLRKSNHGFNPKDSPVCNSEDAMDSARLVFGSEAAASDHQAGQQSKFNKVGHFCIPYVIQA